MAGKSLEIVLVLRKTAGAIKKSPHYQWGHMGSCNCGFLARQITKFSPEEVHSRAMQKHGDWTEQLNTYCPGSGLLMDDLIRQILDFGFEAEDIKHLERLTDRKILQTVPMEKRYLRHNVKEDVLLYLNAWADSVENELLKEVRINLHDDALHSHSSSRAENHKQRSLLVTDPG